MSKKKQGFVIDEKFFEGAGEALCAKFVNITHKAGYGLQSTKAGYLLIEDNEAKGVDGSFYAQCETIMQGVGSTVPSILDFLLERTLVKEVDLGRNVAVAATRLFEAGRAGGYYQNPNPVHQLRAHMMYSTDVEATLRMYLPRIFKSPAGVHAITATDAFVSTEYLWRMLYKYYAFGVNLVMWEKHRGLRNLSDMATNFQSGVGVNAYASAVLSAYEEPLALTVTSSVFAVEFVVTSGWPLPRSHYMDEFQPSMGTASMKKNEEGGLLGSVEQAWGLALMQDVIIGQEGLRHHLFNPALWGAAPDGLTDYMLINSTLQHGFAAVGTLGTTWRSGESVWTAFRALGMLDGIWRSGRNGTLLPVLANTEILELALAAAPISPETRKLLQIFVKTYKTNLEKLFPANLMQQLYPDKPLTWARGMALKELRNLVHGMYSVSKSKDKKKNTDDTRLRLLMGIKEGDLVAVQTLASLWWTLLLVTPDLYPAPGKEHPVLKNYADTHTESSKS